MHGFAEPLSTPVASPPSRTPIDLQPTSAYEALTRQQVETLAAELREIKSRLNNIFYIVIGSILVDMLTRWIGS